MARRAGRACAEPGCPAVVSGDSRYCDHHGAIHAAEYDSRRGSSTARGYGYRWQKIRKMQLINEPFCANIFGDHGDVLVMATEVDHIKPKEKGGGDEPGNLQSLCKRCHSKKTAVEDGRWG